LEERFDSKYVCNLSKQISRNGLGKLIYYFEDTSNWTDERDGCKMITELCGTDTFSKKWSDVRRYQN
jgi:hypothetical protein